MPQLATFRLNQLRSLIESDSRGGSEPYLWVTYFAVDSRNFARPDPVTTHTPVANFSAQVDPGPFNFMMAGCVVLLLEEDETPDRAIRAGRNAYASAIHQELNNLVREQIQTQNPQPVTQEDIRAIRNAVEPKVKSAIRSKLTLGQKLFGDQDDLLGFAHVAFINEEIATRDFEFPQLGGAGNRFVLSGSLTVGPVPPEPVDPCAELRAAVQAKRDQVKALHSRKVALQVQLQNATPQAKPALIQQIKDIGADIVQAEQELRQRESALKLCETGVIDPGR